MNKFKLILLVLLFTGMANAQKTILNKTFDGSVPTESEYGEITPTGIDNVLWTSAGKFIFGGNKQYPGGEDAWFTYTASGLKVNATYTVEMTGAKGQGWVGVSMALAAWAPNATPSNGTVVSNALIADVSTLSEISMTNTFTATSTTMVFGIGMGKNGPQNYYQRVNMESWKITENPPAEYNINYHNVGSKNHEDNPDTYLGIDGLSSLELPYDSLGYDFSGWFYDAAFSSAVANPVIAVNSSGDKNFYAKWEASALSGTVGISGIAKAGRTLTAVVEDIENNTGSLSYQWQSGDGSTFANISGATANTYTLTESEAGKYIRLLVTSSIQTGTLQSTTAQTVLAASVNTYVITYDANGGTDGYITTEEVASGATTAVAANPTRKGYELMGWNTAANGSGSAFNNETTVSASITVYAQWEIVTYTVNFNNNGAYATKTTDIENNLTVDLPSAPSKTGYTFAGWNTQADGRGDAFTSFSEATKDLTVYAQWDLITYTVTFDADGNYASKETSIEKNYKVALPEAPSKEGFTFKNWNTQADGLGTPFSSETVVTGNMTVYAQWREIINAIPVAVNLNMKHSVDGVSDFGRERHITSHTSNTESDWRGHEEMMDYFFNDLDVYAGRDNGSAGWKNKMITEDPNKPHWPDLESIKSNATTLKNWYDGSDFSNRHQYEARRNSMIMGLNPHGVYPSLDWGKAGKMNSGWQTWDVDAAAYFIANYLDQNFAKTPDEIGEPLPVYWECMNEPDMKVAAGWDMFLSSFEKLYEFHNLSAQEIRSKLGEYAPKIGGFTWGQHDFWAPDLINRWPVEQRYYNNSDAALYPVYDNMWLGNDGKGTRAGGSTLHQGRTNEWWQWDALFQEFMEVCGENMDFYSLHFYDWPLENNGGVIRTGSPIEASLDMLESYDVDRFGERKDVIISEFGSVSDHYVCGLGYKRRDWENLRPFNQMFMQFLERPSHLALTMPFAPVKAIWGDWWNADGSLSQRYSVTMMDPVGEYKQDPYKHEDWEWSDIILWYELWKDVKGTRIDTKSANPDIQVDAYVDGKHVYLILNNMELSPEYLNLNMFDEHNYQVKSVTLTHQYLDLDKNRPVNDIKIMASLPAQVKLDKSATMILDIEYENEVIIDQESKETKYISERLSSEKNYLGRDKYYSAKHSGDLITKINGVDVPTIGEAVLRIGMRTWNGVKANVTVNGSQVLTMTSQSPSINVKGREVSRGAGGFFCVLEVPVPLNLLKENNDIKINVPHTSPDYTSVQLQVWDMTKAPGRFEEGQEVLPTALSLIGDNNLMNGKKMSFETVFIPSNTTNKALEWSSSNPSVISVDQYGILTANAASGSAIITATSLEDGNVFATKTVNTEAFQAVSVTGIEIEQGDFITVENYVNTPLSAKVFPVNADIQEVKWSSTNSRYVSVFENSGKVVGQSVGKTEYIIATVTDGDKTFTDSIEVYVTVMGGESIFNRLLPEVIRPYPESSLSVVVRAFGSRTVKLEISKDNTVIASGETTMSFSGDKTVEVPYQLSGTPVLNADYDVTFSLYDGDTKLDSKTGTVKMVDHHRAESVAIIDGIRAVKKGETIQLSAKVMPENTYNKKVTWESLATSIATVDAQTGVVTGVSAGKAEIKVTTDDGNFTDKVEVDVQTGTVVVDLESITLPTSIVMFPESEKTIDFTLVPSWTTQTDVEWSSDNSSIVSVDEQGKLSSSNATGTATITVKSKDNAAISASCQVIVSENLVVQAEDFDNTGGDHDGFVVNEEKTGINYNQSGDWAEYEVYFPKTASYKTRYYIGAPADNTEISAKLYIDGTLAHTTKFTPTGDWDTMKPFVSTSKTISEGWHTIRVESAGSSDWQWNADRYEFFISGASAIENTINHNIKLYPNPASEMVKIDGERVDVCKVYNMTGGMVSSRQVFDNIINTSALPNGIYFLELYYDNKKSTHKLSIKH